MIVDRLILSQSDLSAVAATWFVKRKSIAVGIVATGASVGECFSHELGNFNLNC